MEYRYCLCYGSLRVGEYNYNSIIEQFGKDSIKYIKTVHLYGYAMFSLGQYPAAIETYRSGEFIVCDLLAVSPSVDSYIANMELGAGYTGYSQATTVTENNTIKSTQATIYLFEDDMEESLSYIGERVYSGDWIKFNTKAALFNDDEN